MTRGIDPRSVLVGPEQGSLSVSGGGASSNTLTINFIQDSGSRSTSIPTGRMAPCVLIADVWSNSFSGEPLKSRTKWSFGDSTATITIPDPDKYLVSTNRGNRPTNANASEQQQGWVGGYIYTTNGTYAFNASHDAELRTNFQYSTNFVVAADTRLNYFVDSSNGSDANDGSSNSRFATIAAAMSATNADDVNVILTRGLIYPTTTITFSSRTNWILQSEQGAAGAKAIVQMTANNNNDDLFVFPSTCANIGLWELVFRPGNAGHVYRGAANETAAISINNANNCWMLDCEMDGEMATTGSNAFLAGVTWVDGGDGFCCINFTDGPLSNKMYTQDQVLAGAHHVDFVFLGVKTFPPNDEHMIRCIADANNTPAGMGLSLGWCEGDFVWSNLAGQGDFKGWRFQNLNYTSLWQCAGPGGIEHGYDGAACRNMLVDSCSFFSPTNTHVSQGIEQPGDRPSAGSVFGAAAVWSSNVLWRNNVIYRQSNAGNNHFMDRANNAEVWEDGSNANNWSLFNCGFVFATASSYGNRCFWLNRVPGGSPAIPRLGDWHFANCYIALPTNWSSTTQAVIQTSNYLVDITGYSNNVSPTSDRYPDWADDDSAGASITFTNWVSALTSNASGNIQESLDPETLLANGWLPGTNTQAYTNGVPLNGVHHDYRGVDREYNTNQWAVGPIGKESA